MRDDWSNLFPTRTGDAQGGATERQMAAKVDISGFRTVIQNNPDGSVTMMKTRGGAVEYTTTPAPKTKVVTACVGVMGPIQESVYASRQWYSSSDTDGLTTEQIAALELELTMTSTDGIFKFLRQPLKKMVGTIGVDEQGEPSTTPVTIWFARSATVMPVVDPAVTGLKVTEKAARTYYDAVPAHGKGPHSFGLHYAIQRVKTLSLKFSSANACDAVMTFSKDVAGTPKTDFGNVNGASSETGLTNRTFYSGGGLKQVKLAVANKLNQWGFKDKGWFLDYLGGDNAYSLARRSKMLEITGTGIPVRGAPDLRPDCANLSKVQMFGQMWHGLATVDGLKTPERRLSDDVTIVPEQVRKIYDFTLPFGGDTYYVKSPAELPIPVTPDSFLAIGAKFTNYALLSGEQKYYSCTGNFYIGRGKFIHFNENNVAHVLSLDVAGSTIGPGGGISGTLLIVLTVKIRIYDWGEVGAYDGLTKTQIFMQEYPVPNQYAGEYAIAGNGFGESIVSGSPTGREALIELTEMYHAYTGRSTIWVFEFLIPPEKTSITGSLLWSAYLPSDSTTGARTRKGVVTNQWLETTGSGIVMDKWYEEGYVESVYLPYVFKRRMLAVAGYAIDGTRYLVECEYRETSGTTTETAVYEPVLRSTTIRDSAAPPTPAPAPFWEFTDSAPAVEGYERQVWDYLSLRAEQWQTNAQVFTNYNTPPNSVSVTDNVKQFTCGAMPPITATSSNPASPSIPLRTTFRVSNNLALLEVRDVGGAHAVAFIFNGGYSATTDPAPTYAALNPVTNELSVGTTPRCFV